MFGLTAGMPTLQLLAEREAQRGRVESRVLFGEIMKPLATGRLPENFYELRLLGPNFVEMRLACSQHHFTPSFFRFPAGRFNGRAV